MGICQATPDAHCCWLGAAGECKYLDKTHPDGMCTLRTELGSWDAVHADPRYINDLRPFWNAYMPDEDCGTWPPKGHDCATCGVTGD